MKATRLILLAVLAVALAGCNLASFFGIDPGADDDLTFPGDGSGDDGLSGRIDTNTILPPTDSNPDYTVTGNLDVGAELTIEPGVTIAFAENALLTIESTGALIAEGTATDGILLTSIDVGSGIRWSGIAVESASAKNSLSYVTVQNAGSDDAHYLSGWKNVGVSVSETARLSVRNSTIEGSGGWGLASEGEITTFVANSFQNNAGPAALIHPNDWGVIDGASSFNGNGYDGVVVDTAPSLSEAQSVAPLAGGATYLVDGDLTVSAGLTIGAGTTVEFDAQGLHGGGFGFLTITTAGYLTADGTAGAPIVFTSSDVAGGQLWNGIEFESASANNVLDYVEVSYAGREAEHYLSGWKKVGVSVQPGGRLDVTNSTFTENDVWGFYAEGEVTAFSGNVFTNNGGPAANINPNDWGVVAGTSSFSGNGHDGIVVDADSSLTEDQTVAPLSGTATYLVDGLLNVNAGLTIGAGTTIVFDALGLFGQGYGHLVVENGGFLNALGTSTERIVFTTSDLAGGQRWEGITIDTASASNVLDYVEVSYGARSDAHFVSGWTYANIGVEDGGALTITNSTISYAQASGNTAYGLAVDTGASINGVAGSAATISDVSSNTFEFNDADFITK